MTTTTYFNDALRKVALALNNDEFQGELRPRVIRDVYGRLRFAVNSKTDNYDVAKLKVLEDVQASLGAYATSHQVLFHDDFSDPSSVFDSQEWNRTVVPLGLDDDGNSIGESEIQILDRQITGKDWLHPRITSNKAHPHRVVFFGLKGGVGRSTALCMVAWGLARRGKRVLLVDFDLESPGLSGLILPQEQVAEFGVVDWLVEDAVGQGEGVLRRMVSVSSLSDTTPGGIRVASAIGQNEQDYLAKLARVYADVPRPQGLHSIGDRMLTLVEQLEAQETPDIVLIDSRAGLHDLAAVSITRLADTALLFATNGAQTWSGYEQMFAHWRCRPEVARRIREKLAIVRALTPKNNREANIKNFRQKAYALFTELYDEVPQDEADKEAVFFHPAENDESAPHAPILIDWDERFQEFDPNLRPEDGGVTEIQIDATFGVLIKWILEQAIDS
jgi:cellulose biosynthesis protein BcsQ